MKNKGDEKLRARLSRKELQSLCKNFGLPANRSSSEMAKSLASFFENTSSILSGERLGEIREVSFPAYCIPGLLSGAPFNSLEYPREDSHELHSCLIEGGNKRNFSPTFRSNELGHCSGDKTYDGEGRGCSMFCFQESSNSQFVSRWARNDFNSQVSPTTNLCQDSSGIARDNWVEDMCPIQHTNVTDVNSDSCPKADIFPSSTNTFKAASSSSFEFYVRNEEGINLCVDLSSNPSDWIQKLKSEVNICENMCQNKSSSFHQELGRFGESNKQLKNSFLQNIDAQQVKDGNVPSVSSPSKFMKESKNAMLNIPDGGDGSLTSIAIKPNSNAVVVSEHLQEDKGLVSSEPNSDARDGTRSCTDENGCSTTVDSDVNTPGKKISRNSLVSILDCPKSRATLEHQNSKPSSEICEYSTVENSCSLANSQVVIAGSSTGVSLEMPLLKAEIQRKDASSMPCKNGEFIDLVDSMDNTETEQSALANSSEPDIDIGRNHMPTSVEDWEGNKPVDGGESSECSQMDDSLGKICLRVHNSGSNEEHQKKRPHMDSTRILRSAKRFAGKVLPRRSTRLVPKRTTCE
ncbi:uncharacterized protein LOC116117323 isoform X2 [Pistacia vera]|uniref:uncharacterized protein LOC116117323 isoform X2 n=1 Tax=Pistacia vera TaxID=55513 RepID=UPI001263B8BB|nr:uncharacterized protein LOC116117323 isoform X2 [Pistacia vera]